MLIELNRIGSCFSLPGYPVSAYPIKNGHINETYLVEYKSPETKYVFQKINSYVFRNPQLIMNNIKNIMTYLQVKNCDNQKLHFHFSKDGELYVIDLQGCFWRVMDYIDSVTFTTPNDLTDKRIISGTGEAFGKFHADLADFNPNLLHITIPDFHNTKQRIGNLYRHAQQDFCNRYQYIRKELEVISEKEKTACAVWESFLQHEIPLRTVHNDTKCSNVLFDSKTHRPLTVIDLDTVMPGLLPYDFGDAVRSVANTAAEDEINLKEISVDLSRYTAFCEGYLSYARQILTEEEKKKMPAGILAVTVELAARFLDDFLIGDRYFKIDYPEHNLIRARAQLKLAEDIFNKQNLLFEIFEKINNS